MRDRAPQFPIAPILRALGFENVPDVRGNGHAKILCALHDDHNPSASVSQYGFVCWACGKHGDAIKLLREEEGLTYADAVNRAKELTGVTDSGGGSESGWGASLLD